MDPFKKRENPEIRGILNALRSEWKDFIAEKHYTRRRGYAEVLIASLQSLLDEPEFIPPPVKEGPGSGDRYSMKPLIKDSEPEVRFLDETPFDRAGAAKGQHFFYDSRISKLYVGEPVDPYHIQYFSHTMMIYGLEKRYASAQETNQQVPPQVINEIVWRKKGRRGSDKPGNHFLFLDPRGCDEKEPPVSVFLGSYVNLKSAARAADRLSGRLKVRLAVGTVVHRLDNH